MFRVSEVPLYVLLRAEKRGVRSQQKGFSWVCVRVCERYIYIYLYIYIYEYVCIYIYIYIERERERERERDREEVGFGIDEEVGDVLIGPYTIYIGRI